MAWYRYIITIVIKVMGFAVYLSIHECIHITDGSSTPFGIVVNDVALLFSNGTASAFYHAYWIGLIFNTP